MIPPPPEIVEVMNAIVNDRGLRHTAIRDHIILTQGLLSIPDEHTQQMVAACEYDGLEKAGESHQKVVALYKAITESAQVFREAIHEKLKAAGFPAADMPKWIV